MSGENTKRMRRKLTELCCCCGAVARRRQVVYTCVNTCYVRSHIRVYTCIHMYTPSYIHMYICVGCFALVKIFRKSGHEISQQMKHLRERERESDQREQANSVGMWERERERERQTASGRRCCCLWWWRWCLRCRRQHIKKSVVKVFQPKSSP